MLQRRVGEQLDDRSLELAHIRPHVLGDEPDDVLGDRHLEMIELCFLAENRDAMLEIAELDVGDHPPLETTDESRFEAGDVRWRTIARQDDLSAGLVQRIEGVEE